MYMGPIERWQGKCIPAEYYRRLDESDLSSTQKKYFRKIQSFYETYSNSEHLVENRDAPVFLLICEFPNFEAFATVAYDLSFLEKKCQNEDNKIDDFLRVPKPTHWETDSSERDQ